MIQYSCSRLAYSLLLTNEESHKRQSSSERLLGVQTELAGRQH